MLYRKDTGEILGVHIIGLHAADLIHEASNAIATKQRVQVRSGQQPAGWATTAGKHHDKLKDVPATLICKTSSGLSRWEGIQMAIRSPGLKYMLPSCTTCSLQVGVQGEKGGMVPERLVKELYKLSS